LIYKNFILIIIFSILILPLTNSWAQTIAEVIKPKLDRELTLESNNISGKAVVLVYSNTSWQGEVSGGNMGSSTKQGSGDAKYTVSCGDLNMAQGLIQKNTEGGYVAVVIIENGKILASEATNAQFGIAHAVGECSGGFGGGGGCLIATATFGSELAPQVQQLRELRDNHLMKTESGSTFMTGFNQLYYSFSPTIADLERESPIFKEIVKLTITPLITSLSILNYVDMDSEANVLGYGIGLILLNVGMYLVAPVGIGIVIARKF